MELTRTESVFAQEGRNLFTAYELDLAFEDKLMGGVPKSPKIIEGWLRSQAGIDDKAEVEQAMIRTLQELGADVHPGMVYDELVAKSEELAAVKSTNGFKLDDNGLYIEDRQVKAMLKESVNILYAGDRWGKTRKGPRSFVAERAFVKPARIYLGRYEPDGVELVIGHVSDAAGKRSTLAYHEYAERPTITIQVEVLRDELTTEQWTEIWCHAERNGLGALRSQSHGRFAVTRWERV